MDDIIKSYYVFNRFTGSLHYEAESYSEGLKGFGIGLTREEAIENAEIELKSKLLIARIEGPKRSFWQKLFRRKEKS